MIRKINKIKNFGIFNDFSWPVDLPEFKRFNVLYGWNWTGKTTLSRIFQCYESGHIDDDYPNSHFDFELDNGVKLNQQNLDNVLNVRVFNKLFIEDNISWDGKTQPIYFLGKENIALEEEISKLKTQKQTATNDIINLKEKLQIKQREEERLSVNTAKNIKDNLTTSLNDVYRFYNKNNFINFIQNNKEKLQTPQQLLLSENEFQDYKKSIVREIKEKISEILMPRIDLLGLIKNVNDILSKNITSDSIKRLAENWEINNWVKDGLEIHKKSSSEICEFCGSRLPEGLINKLEAHFNDEYNKCIKSIEVTISEIEGIKIKLNIPDSSRLYADYQKDFLNTKNKTENAEKTVNKELDKLISKLLSKKQAPFQKYKIEDNEIDFEKLNQLNTSSEILNQLIEKHNKLTDNFDSEIRKNKENLESHLVAEVFDSYQESNKNIAILNSQIIQKQNEIETYKKTIDEKEKDILDHRIPAVTINDLLKMYFGREEIKLHVESDGYQIKRYGEIANNLSEGEKTAISFSYFITKLEERDFDLCNGIVVVDDPVSSLDANALFQAFSFMKNHCKNAGQLFILTHNYDLFRQVKNWFRYANGNFYMITNHLNQNRERIAKISKIDKLLTKYESEYHYLFSLLYRFSKLKDQDLEAVYNLPNIARKFIECFLSFKIPKEGSLHDKIENLNYNKDKQTKINRFIQTHSHSRNEDGIINFDMSILSETPRVINDLLGLVEHEDKRHYDLLCECVTSH